MITRQLATLVESGLPLEESLIAVAEQGDKNSIKSMVMGVRTKVTEGYGLAESMAEYPKVFNRLYRAMIAAGEKSGHLDKVLNRLADYTEARHQARQKIQLAAIYPIILCVVAISIVVFLLTYVVPDIIEVFVNNGQELPALTQGLLTVSDFLANYGMAIFIILVVSGIGFKLGLRQDKFRFAYHRRLLGMPFIKKISRGSNTSQFASTLSILNSSGVPLVDAMRISSEVIANDCLKAALVEASTRVSEGGNLHLSLEQTGYFPPMMIHMIASGESSGELDQMLERTALQQESDLQGLIETIVGLFEPLMLLFMGGVVLIIVLAIMLPILNMSNLVS